MACLGCYLHIERFHRRAQGSAPINSYLDTVRSPLAVLAVDLKDAERPDNVLNYINDFRRRLHVACATAYKKLSCKQVKMKELSDRKAESCIFEPGDQVLALLPLVCSPFQAKFSGPYTVKCHMSDRDYSVHVPDRRKKVQWCHINLLKPYHSPNSASGGG